MSIEEFRHIKIFIDSNNYKEKAILRELIMKQQKLLLKLVEKLN